MTQLAFIVRRPNGEIIARFRHPEDAAAYVSTQGDGHWVQYRRKSVWLEGREAFSAEESFDRAAHVMLQRIGEEVV